MFLRVIFLLILHDHPPLVSGALKLLFRHFDQRQELVGAMKNVQLLISASNVNQYEQIKEDVDELRRLTEESELWIPSTSSECVDDERSKRTRLDNQLKDAGLVQRPGDSRLYFETDSDEKHLRATVLSASICFDKLAGALQLDEKSDEATSQAASNYKRLQAILVRWIEARVSIFAFLVNLQ